MIKISTDGSGVREVIIGCPFCDHVEAENLRWHLSSWWVDPNMDNRRYSFEVKFCPFCGEELPNIEEWCLSKAEKEPKLVVTKNVYTAVAKCDLIFNDPVKIENGFAIRYAVDDLMAGIHRYYTIDPVLAGEMVRLADDKTQFIVETEKGSK